MIQFVNAKINVGLNIVERRSDGYHNLETVFYPVGLHNGTQSNPNVFCDILEITRAEEYIYEWGGRSIDCRPEDNLVCRAVKSYRAKVKGAPVRVRLEKYLPDGAGLGGGSADASFVLRIMNELDGKPLSDRELEEMALTLGADCPVFIANRPAYGEGVGERLTPIGEVLKNKWCVIVKPPIYVSTKEAFAGIVPCRSEIYLPEVLTRPISEWREYVKNDFEASLFPHYPELAEIKSRLYVEGAEFALMSGSGSSLYGIYADEMHARTAVNSFQKPNMKVFVCKL